MISKQKILIVDDDKYSRVNIPIFYKECFEILIIHDGRKPSNI